MGIFYRTIRMIESGIKPIYVFDGKPPHLKTAELSKRSDRRADAVVQAALAAEEGAVSQLDKFNKRTVKVTQKHNDECKQLLSLMGVPWLQAPSEAEAQCAALVRAGIAYAVGSEDMDTITFGSPILLRHLTVSEARKLPIVEMHLQPLLEGLGMSMAQVRGSSGPSGLLSSSLTCASCLAATTASPSRALGQPRLLRWSSSTRR